MCRPLCCSEAYFHEGNLRPRPIPAQWGSAPSAEWCCTKSRMARRAVYEANNHHMSAQDKQQLVVCVPGEWVDDDVVWQWRPVLKFRSDVEICGQHPAIAACKLSVP
eukprot:CAMPEP_0180795772 /NCGR_PEP_ID=MMETSP1038_2-20121128/56401_1 /TAXON_ID=632150 /ORGANISM="Azadinium spinosum, Strain 3D9" /LENGTH=106 /DNA_ID=CAMNT_0022834761 /DNA_START=172 /DNA_END=493 /DNA_ORIENTATION=+